MIRNLPCLYQARKMPIVLRKLEVIPSLARSLVFQDSRKIRLLHFFRKKKSLSRQIWEMF